MVRYRHQQLTEPTSGVMRASEFLVWENGLAGNTPNPGYEWNSAISAGDLWAVPCLAVRRQGHTNWADWCVVHHQA